MFSYYLTMQVVNKNQKYKGTHLRFKINRNIGPGKLTLWTDVSQFIDQMNDNKKTDYYYVWLDYDYTLYSTDFGSISIQPTIRAFHKQCDSNYNRIKFELTTGIKFK